MPRAVVALVAATLLLVGCSSPGHPAGWKPVDYSGIRVYVPANWTVQAASGLGVGCRTWSQSTVVLDQTPVPQGTNLLCAVETNNPTAATVVMLSRVTPTRGVQAWAATQTSHHSVSGGPATFHGLAGFYIPSVHSDTSRFGSSFLVYQSGIVVSASSSDLHLAQQIVHTVSVSPH